MPSTWLPDPSHYPEQLTPLSATVWFEAIGRGLHEAMRELRGPFGGFEARTELGWAYEGELEPDWEPDPDALPKAALGLAWRWEHEMMPRVHAITEELHALRPEAPAPKEAGELLDHFWSLVLEQWMLHFLVVIPSQIATEMLHDRYVELFGSQDELAPYRVLDGVPNESTEADGWLWRLSDTAKRLGVDDVLREFPPDLTLERLSELANGRAFLRELSDYLARYGGRSRWHELSLPREVEFPQMTLESIRLFLESGSPPSLSHADQAQELEEKLLSEAPDLRGVLDAAKVGYALKESHAYHIDYPGLLATREVLLGFGRRLLAEGRIDGPDDVWMLRRGEVRNAVTDTEGGDLRALVAERRGELARGLQEGPRPFLGEPPPEVDRHAALEKFYGRAQSGGPGSLQGIGASPGVVEGPARVVSGATDFDRVRSGDILVATTTTPAWTPLFPSLAGLVTETGGILSHAAIVAREYGLPAVVGADRATQLLTDGTMIRVNGSTGEVAPV
ncbi:MAG TPA: PEP-utilizing enzyme [Actinomycetota bacterium]|nr:PEP-utilizing enzyme [Actinomycetota bacterium]